MPDTAPFQVTADDPVVPGILELIQRTFAYMEPRIDPPSSMHRLTVASIQEQCTSGEVWAIGKPPLACVFFTEQTECLYVGKLAVCDTARGKGYARKLIDLAEGLARTRGLPALELNTRIELVENHQTFQSLGFVKVGKGKHDGFSRPTYIVMRKPIEPVGR